MSIHIHTSVGAHIAGSVVRLLIGGGGYEVCPKSRREKSIAYIHPIVRMGAAHARTYTHVHTRTYKHARTYTYASPPALWANTRSIATFARLAARETAVWR